MYCAVFTFNIFNEYWVRIRESRGREKKERNKERGRMYFTLSSDSIIGILTVSGSNNEWPEGSKSETNTGGFKCKVTNGYKVVATGYLRGRKKK